MLWTVFIILLVLWLLGYSVWHVGGALIHFLLIAAIVVLIIRLIQGRVA